MEIMEPYTLGWWIDLLLECSFRKECVNINRIEGGNYLGIMVESDKLAIKYQRYDKLENWIAERIIKYYGE